MLFVERKTFRVICFRLSFAGGGITLGFQPLTIEGTARDVCCRHYSRQKLKAHHTAKLVTTGVKLVKQEKQTFHNPARILCFSDKLCSLLFI